MKKILFLSLVASLAILASCSKDDTNPVPAIVQPTNSTVQVNSPVDITFNYTAKAGFKSSNASATNGDVTVKSDGIEGSTSGSVVVTFTPGASAGAASVVLTVTDNENQTSSATAVIDVVVEEVEIPVTANIAENTTWKSGKVYILKSRIAVLSGVTLTIEQGVIVKGQAGTGSNATALLIARGGTIKAEGTASEPIIFTSVADEIMPGQIESPNLDPVLNGLWGGLIICGNAPISADAVSVQIEGIPPSDQNGLYGGDNPTDNSGIIRYVSIRHGGANIGEGNEINGLTLGGVGSETIIENVEIVANQDDGLECFGGTVTVKNLIVWNTGDDAVDTDQAFAGTVDNFVVINPGDECMELDGPEGTYDNAGHTIKNGTCYADEAEGLVDLDDNTRCTIMNVYFFGLKEGQDFDLNPAVLTCSNLQATLPEGATVTDYFKDGSDAYVNVVSAGTNTVGADLTKFQGWSWSALSGALNDF